MRTLLADVFSILLFPASCYRMVGSKLTLAFMELEIRQFASAFSISSLALAALAFTESGMVGFNVMAVNWNFPSTNSSGPSATLSYEVKARPARSATARNVVIRQMFADATNRSSGDQIPSCPLNSGGVATWISGFPAQEMIPLRYSVHLTDV